MMMARSVSARYKYVHQTVDVKLKPNPELGQPSLVFSHHFYQSLPTYCQQVILKMCRTNIWCDRSPQFQSPMKFETKWNVLDGFQMNSGHLTPSC